MKMYVSILKVIYRKL